MSLASKKFASWWCTKHFNGNIDDEREYYAPSSCLDADGDDDDGDYDYAPAASLEGDDDDDTEGETLKQILRFLGHESIDQLLSESPTSILFSNILSKTRKGGKDLEFSLVNCIWVDKKVEPVRSSYQKVLETVYKTEARYVDFHNKVKCDEAVREINTWVRKVTKGLIPTIVDGFGKDDLIVLANALYFKGAWSNPFIAKMTKSKYFYLINGKKVSVPFMTVERELIQSRLKCTHEKRIGPTKWVRLSLIQSLGIGWTHLVKAVAGTWNGGEQFTSPFSGAVN
ncbi:serpin-ZX [Tanacetum coccineum]